MDFADKSEAVKAGLRKAYPNGRFGSLASNWKGGRRKGGCNGRYILIHKPDHPNATKDGYVMEHRLVVEQELGRILKRDEFVHHINGDTHDNCVENLIVCSKKEHSRIHNDAVKEVVRLKKLLDEHGISY
jgi:hypothetical protein